MTKQKLQLESVHVFLSRWLQLCCKVTFTHEVSLHPCFWQKLVVCFYVLLHILECRFFYNLLNGCFTQGFTQERADLGHGRLQVLKGKQTFIDLIDFVTSFLASFCSPSNMKKAEQLLGQILPKSCPHRSGRGCCTGLSLNATP